MKLLNAFVSPFAARVRIAIYAYGLPVEIVPSGQWLPDYQKSPDYLKINPIGRVPALVLDDGTALPESGVIVEYLADAFPATALRPGDPQSAAHVRLLAHLAELYLQIPANPLFGQFFAQQRDPQQIERCIASMNEGLSHLDHFLAGEASTGDHNITIADCALAPFLFFFAESMAAAFGKAAIIEQHAKVFSYMTRIKAVPAVARVLSEMRQAIAASPLREMLPP